MNERIKSANRALYSLMGAGLHGLNGVNPLTASHLINIYVKPCLTYGLEALCLSENDMAKLEGFYKKTLRQIQHLPQSTGTPACYLLLGTLPIEATIHIRTLCMFGAILRRQGSVEQEVAIRQLALKNDESRSWFIYTKNLLHRYKLPPYHILVQAPPTQSQWKQQVKRAVEETWWEQLQNDAARLQTLEHINVNACSIGKPHPLWTQCGTNPYTTTIAMTKAKLLVQRYALESSYVSGNRKSQTCKLCKCNKETLKHFLLDCTMLAPARTEPLMKLTDILSRYNRTPTVKFILDPSHVDGLTDADHRAMEMHSRNLCYHLHRRRTSLLRDL